MSGEYLIVRGGRVMDAAWGLDRKLDVVIRGGKIVALQEPGASLPRGKVLEASGCWVVPGLVDLHVHLRQPGNENAEDVRSGTEAAAAGGFTTVVCQPNTKPPLDSPSVLGELGRAISERALVKVLPAGALSCRLEGRRLTDYRKLVMAGARAVSDDGVGTRSLKLLAGALRRGAELGLVVMLHCEQRRGAGVMHLGAAARRLGIPGISEKCESEAVRRALRVLESAGGRMHIQHVSCRRSLVLIARAKQRGLAVTCEATPHHLFLTERDVEKSAGEDGPHPYFKVNPPLRSEADRASLRRALAEGTIDAIASDHAPHTAAEKARGFLQAPFGMIGLETTLGLTLLLVQEGVLSLPRALALLTCGPAGVLGISAGGLRPGCAADVTVFDPRKRWIVRADRLRSRSRNTPFEGWTLPGRVRYTLVDGRVVWREETC